MKKYFIFNENLNIQKVNPEIIYKKKEKNSILPLAKYLNIGYYLIIPLIGGSIFGFLIKKPLIGILIGSIFTFYNLIKLVKTNARN